MNTETQVQVAQPSSWWYVETDVPCLILLPLTTTIIKSADMVSKISVSSKKGKVSCLKHGAFYSCLYSELSQAAENFCPSCSSLVKNNFSFRCFLAFTFIFFKFGTGI